jgi:predicted transcriptional regulator
MFLPAALMVLREDGLIEADGERYALTDAGRTVAEGVPEYALARYTAS